MTEHYRIAMAAAVALVLLSGGTIAEQRARLPPPAQCDDPVVGVWKSHDYFAHVGHWYITELYISRDETDAMVLTGHMKVEMWYGDEANERPPDCDHTTLRYKIHQDATGTISGDQITFGGTNYRLESELCGQFSSYNEDQFAGTIDAELQEFQSLNNDGGIAVNFPSVFRRVRCWDGSPPDPPVEAPPFQPPAGLGCSLW